MMYEGSRGGPMRGGMPYGGRGGGRGDRRRACPRMRRLAGGPSRGCAPPTCQGVPWGVREGGVPWAESRVCASHLPRMASLRLDGNVESSQARRRHQVKSSHMDTHVKSSQVKSSRMPSRVKSRQVSVTHSARLSTCAAAPHLQRGRGSNEERWDGMRGDGTRRWHEEMGRGHGRTREVGGEGRVRERDGMAHGRPRGAPRGNA
jgi:hypothetical protein